jgi:hypothetical protein
MSVGDYPFSTQGGGRCPRCDGGPLKAWYELSEEEREVALRMNEPAGFTPAERAARHRFCTRCWYEERANSSREA